MELDVMGLVSEVVTLPGTRGEVIEVPLPEVKLPRGWVSPEGVTQVCYQFILNLFIIFFF